MVGAQAQQQQSRRSIPTSTLDKSFRKLFLYHREHRAHRAGQAPIRGPWPIAISCARTHAQAINSVRSVSSMVKK